MLQRLRSLRHRFWYGVSERIRWSRGAYRETPARELPTLTLEQARRIAALQRRYQAKFELDMSATTALNNYEYLDILDRAWAAWGLRPPQGGSVCDIGCASFWYAATLMRFFNPHELVGIEVEGHRLFKNGYTRIDHATGYLAGMAKARIVIADYRDLLLPADVVIAWFPFVTPEPVLAWRLPLSLFAPQQFFRQIRRNLRSNGLFVMVNHGAAEAAVAAGWCAAAGLSCVSRHAEPGVLSGHRLQMAAVSCWRR